MKKLLFCAGLVIAATNVTFAQTAQKFQANSTEILSGGTVVASYTRIESRAADDRVTMKMTFTDKSGATIATAMIPYGRKGAKTVITTTKDGREQTMILKGPMDTDMAVEIATQLAEGKYL